MDHRWIPLDMGRLSIAAQGDTTGRDPQMGDGDLHKGTS